MKPTILIALLLTTLAGTALADAHGSKLTIQDVWARATPGQAPNGAAFLTIHNTGDADKLVAAESAVARRTELHTTQMDGGVMKMRHVDGVEVPAKGSVQLKPGSYHVMLMGLVAPLKEGDMFELTLRFASGTSANATVHVRAVGAMQGGHGGHGGMHGHGKKSD